MTRTVSAYQQRQLNETAVEITANTHRLPLGRVEAHRDEVHVFTADPYDLDLWKQATGGDITSKYIRHGVSLRTLRTATDPDGTGATVPVLVCALTTDTDH